MNLVQLTPIEVESNLTAATFIGGGGTSVCEMSWKIILLLNYHWFIATSFLCEAIDLLVFTTSSQVESLDCDVVWNFSSYKAKQKLSEAFMSNATKYLILGLWLLHSFHC